MPLRPSHLLRLAHSFKRTAVTSPSKKVFHRSVPSSSSSSNSPSSPFTNQPLPTLKHRMGSVMEGGREKVWSDRTTDTGDVKDTFTRVRPDSPIPEDIRKRAHFLCAQYLGGAWKTAQLSAFTIQQITGGMSNLLFLVKLCPTLPLENTEPRQALLRIHCQADIDQLLSESVVFTLLSERNLGPKLLGVFPGGRFEEFIPSRALQCMEISEDRLSKIIAPMVARVHSLDVPIGKEPQLINRARGWLDKWSAYEVAINGIEMYCTQAQVDPSKFPARLTVQDLSAELDFVEKFIDSIHSPVVFSHNDLQEGNILLINKETDEDPDELALIDFEYCDYNYRGFDFGNHFCEYGIDYAYDSAPFYTTYKHKFQAADQRRRFCQAYLKEMHELQAKGLRIPADILSGDESRDLSKLEEEAELFMPISHIFWSCWALLNAEQSSIAFGYADYARDRMALYYEMKPQLEKYLHSH